jgi:hypothetical protein
MNLFLSSPARRYGVRSSVVKILLLTLVAVALSSVGLSAATGSVKEGGRVTLFASADGSPAPTFQWKKNGVPIPGATGPLLEFVPVKLADAGVYEVEATNAAGSASSPSEQLVVEAVATSTAPAFLLQPVASQTVSSGLDVTIKALASGDPSPTYQWRKDGVTLQGQTSSVLLLAAVTTTHSGNYTVTAQNAAGSVTSSVSSLTVLPVVQNVAPAVKTQPSGQQATVGAPVTFAVEVTGVPAPTVQWYRNGQAIAAATSASYTIAAVTLQDSGAAFSVVASNVAGSTTSSTAVLTVSGSSGGNGGSPGLASPLTGTVISSAPYQHNLAYEGSRVFDGDAATFFAGHEDVRVPYVGRDLGQPMILQRIRYLPRTGFTGRMKDGLFRGANLPDLSDAVTLHQVPFNPPENVWQDVALEGTTKAYRYVFFTTAYENNGNVAEIEFFGKVPSTAPDVGGLPQIISQPENQTVSEGNAVTFSVATNTYQWYRNGEAIPGATQSTYRIGTALGVDSGSYHVVVSNSAGSVASKIATLTVTNVVSESLLGGPVISSAPYADNAYYAGASAFDGSGATFFAGKEGVPFVFVGRDLGQARRITRVRYLPRDGFTGRMTGGRIRGANSPDLSDAVTLHTIAINPPQGVWQDVELPASAGTFRYVFFTTPYEGNGNVAELEFYGSL